MRGLLQRFDLTGMIARIRRALSRSKATASQAGRALRGLKAPASQAGRAVRGLKAPASQVRRALPRSKAAAAKFWGALRQRKTIATQLYLGLGGAVALTLGASVVGWMAFNQVGEAQNRINLESVPDMAAAFLVAQQIGALVDAAPRLTVAQSEEELETTLQEVAEVRQEFERRLEDLASRRADSEGVRRVRVWGRELTDNIEEITEAQAELVELARANTELQVKTRGVDRELSSLLATVVDDQFFYAMTGYRDLGSQPDARERHFTEAEFDRYRQVAALNEGATIAMQLLASAFSASNVDLLVPLRERYEAATGLIGRSIVGLGAGTEDPEIVRLFQTLFDLSVSNDGVFPMRQRELEFEERQVELLAANRRIANDLVAEVEGLVTGLRASTLVATRSSTDTVQTGQTLLLILNLVSIVGAGLIAWLFVGRHLAVRLDRLATRMRGMASGDLESGVRVDGNDEITEMAEALEVFRKHALEVQRLNLVEKLADDLRDKNSELEKVLADLRKAQDQIVMREKLAALGELTAGVAHEIKNPLNFVKNFSEVSEELLQELKEVVYSADGGISDSVRGEVDELCGDLTGNLATIRQHGNRADRIVQDMLSIGRGSSERREAEINSLVKEHASLAFQSARASDPDFQLHIVDDFDPELDQCTVSVVPQDIGRVILNMVSNACHATHEKRMSGSDGYLPTLTLTTKRDGGALTIRVHDNGCGVPPDVVEKMFNPFFTTKPPDKGTGLGLAMSNDIIREHGGTIRVDSTPGEFTEMTVEIPIAGDAADAESS